MRSRTKEIWSMQEKTRKKEKVFQKQIPKEEEQISNEEEEEQEQEQEKEQIPKEKIQEEKVS